MMPFSLHSIRTTQVQYAYYFCGWLTFFILVIPWGFTQTTMKGAFTFPVHDLPLPVGAGPAAMVIEDLDGDSLPDIATAISRAEMNAQTGEGNGLCLYQSRLTDTPYGPIFRRTTSRPRHIVSGQLNGDQSPDLVIAGYESDRLTVYMGIKGGLPGQPVFVPVIQNAFKLNARDIDNDGDTEVVCLSHPTLGAGITLFEIDRAVPGGLVQAASEVSPGVDWRDVSFADLDGDGLAYDLLILQRNPARLIHHNFLTNQRVAHALLANGSATVLAAGNLDNDGSDEVVVAYADPSFNHVPGTVQVLDYTDQKFTMQSSFAVGATPLDLHLADINQDGFLDVVTADTGAGANQNGRIIPDGVRDTITVALGRGDGGFYTATALDVGDIVPTAVAVGDVNGDSRPDLVVAWNADAYILAYYRRVDILDLFKFATRWGHTDWPGYDFDRSGLIDKRDIKFWWEKYRIQQENDAGL